MITNHNPNLLSREKIARILLTQAIIVIPLLVHLPLWIFALWASVAFWRWKILNLRYPAPSTKIVNLITVLCVIGLYANFAGKVGMDAALGLLVCTFVLKILEMQTQRDGQLVIFIGFIATTTQLLLSQTILAAFYALVCCIFLIGSWRGIYLRRQKKIQFSIKHNYHVLIQSIPVMLILFVILPRIGPLWTMPSEQIQATGFSDELSPGDISQLVRRHEAAFRVSFENEKPDAHQLYWRGLILSQFDGRSWKHLKDSIVKTPTNQLKKQLLILINYKIILEAHGHPWLFTLGQAQYAESDQYNLLITKDGLIKSQETIQQNLQYQVKSDIENETASELSDFDRNIYLKLPQFGNPQSRELAQQWVQNGLTTKDIIAEIQRRISSEFSYTLQPPTLGDNSIDDFLFSSKRGFCEHFASSFAFLMRAAGIPARLVVGYQGGTWNEIEQYLLVSQADAHAWVEIWRDNKWQRIDPTAFVAPNRIETGIDQALTASDQELLSRRWQQSPWLWQIRKRWDALEYNWTKFVLNYDNEYQNQIIETLFGKNDPWRIAYSLIGLLLTAVALTIGIYWFKNRAQFSTEYEKIAHRLEQKLQKRGYHRHNEESLSAFCRRVAKSEQDSKSTLNQVAIDFEKVLYGDKQIHQSQLNIINNQIKLL